MSIFQELINTDHSQTTIIIRLMVGVVFLSEGIQKFLFPTMRGPGWLRSLFRSSKELVNGRWT
ncbi:hypothetical protein [Salegentibacter sediminis]|uniref:hypothetical protein n=1 Tax=Salegentibacter sediminis TaxID=1930251 RepID=UPI001E5571ED|nr:hypothetical protein [Salegentibacter sediminis]